MTEPNTHLFSERQDDFVFLSLRRITPVMCVVIASVNFILCLWLCHQFDTVKFICFC